MAAFAAENGLAASTFYQWVKGPRGPRAPEDKRAERKAPTNEATRFAEVSVVSRAPGRAAVLTITLRGGHSVTIEGGTVDPAWLASVLKMVSAC